MMPDRTGRARSWAMTRGARATEEVRRRLVAGGEGQEEGNGAGERLRNVLARTPGGASPRLSSCLVAGSSVAGSGAGGLGNFGVGVGLELDELKFRA